MQSKYTNFEKVESLFPQAPLRGSAYKLGTESLLKAPKTHDPTKHVGSGYVPEVYISNGMGIFVLHHESVPSPFA
jgi:hypothetical protein